MLSQFATQMARLSFPINLPFPKQNVKFGPKNGNTKVWADLINIILLFTNNIISICILVLSMYMGEKKILQPLSNF